MAKPSNNTETTQLDALSIKGPEVGYADEGVPLSGGIVNLDEYKGKYITVSCEVNDFYISFVTGSTVLVSGAAALGTEGVVKKVVKDQDYPFVVPPTRYELRYAPSGSAGGTFRIHPS